MEYLTSTVYISGICLLMIVCCCVYCCFFTKSTKESPLLQTTLKNEKEKELHKKKLNQNTPKN